MTGLIDYRRAKPACFIKKLVKRKQNIMLIIAKK